MVGANVTKELLGEGHGTSQPQKRLICGRAVCARRRLCPRPSSRLGLQLSHDPAMLNHVGFWKHVCSKALADAAGRVSICFHRNAMTAQETPVCLSVFVAADCHDHHALREKRTRKIAKRWQFCQRGNTVRLPKNSLRAKLPAKSIYPFELNLHRHASAAPRAARPKRLYRTGAELSARVHFSGTTRIR